MSLHIVLVSETKFVDDNCASLHECVALKRLDKMAELVRVLHEDFPSVYHDRVKPMTYTNAYLLPLNLALGITRIGQGLVSTVSG